MRGRAVTTTTAPSESLSPEALAAKYGLTPSAARPRFGTYLKQVWERRHFISSYATARMTTMYSGARLGQLWQVLTPLFNAAVYYLMFGLLLGASGNIENYPAFLMTGVFVMTFTTRSITSGARSIGGNLALIRALHFPRACLPLAFTIIELQQLMISMGVLAILVVVLGEPITLWWLLLVPAVLLQTLFNIGVSMAIARVGAFNQDINQLLPFLLRTWLYMSGVFFSIPDKMAGHPLVVHIMSANPAAVYIELVREALLNGPVHGTADHPVHPAYSIEELWLLGAGWAVVALLVGFWFFWSAEEKYGRG